MLGGTHPGGEADGGRLAANDLVELARRAGEVKPAGGRWCCTASKLILHQQQYQQVRFASTWERVCSRAQLPSRVPSRLQPALPCPCPHLEPSKPSKCGSPQPLAVSTGGGGLRQPFVGGGPHTATTVFMTAVQGVPPKRAREKGAASAKAAFRAQRCAAGQGAPAWHAVNSLPLRLLKPGPPE